MDDGIPIWDIILKGEILTACHKMLYFGELKEKLKLKILMKCKRYDAYARHTSYPVEILLDGNAQKIETH